MKKIGFVDYYISEWHANNYPAWFKETTAALGYEYEVAYAWAQEYVSPVDGRNTDEWCEAMGVTRCQTVEELCEKSDVIVLLAPSNPEQHLQLAQKVLPYGKRTYIDKSFADTVENAEAIVALAKEYGTPFFSSSALRYATELNAVGPCRSMTTMGGYWSVEEYIIHQAEMIVKKIGVGAREIKGQKITDNEYTFTIRYDDDRSAGMHFVKAGLPYTVLMTKGDGSDAVYKTVQSDPFKGLIHDMLVFFETGEGAVDVAETLEVNRIMVAAIKAKNAPDTWVNV